MLTATLGGRVYSLSLTDEETQNSEAPRCYRTCVSRREWKRGLWGSRVFGHSIGTYEWSLESFRITQDVKKEKKKKVRHSQGGTFPRRIPFLQTPKWIQDLYIQLHMTPFGLIICTLWTGHSHLHDLAWSFVKRTWKHVSDLEAKSWFHTILC